MNKLLYSVKVQASKINYSFVSSIYDRNIGTFAQLYSLFDKMSFTDKMQYVKYLNNVFFNISRLIETQSNSFVNYINNNNFFVFKGSIFFVKSSKETNGNVVKLSKKTNTDVVEYLHNIVIKNPENYIDIFNLFYDDKMNKGKLYNEFDFNYSFTDNEKFNIFTVRTEVELIDSDFSFSWYSKENINANHKLYPSFIKIKNE